MKLKYYCDKCIAEQVRALNASPTSHPSVRGLDGVPFLNNYECDQCGKREQCISHPQMDNVENPGGRDFIELACKSYYPLLKCCRQILSNSRNGKTLLYGDDRNLLMGQYLEETIKYATDD